MGRSNLYLQVNLISKEVFLDCQLYENIILKKIKIDSNFFSIKNTFEFVFIALKNIKIGLENIKIDYYFF